MAPVEDNDSGMESQEGSQSQELPEEKSQSQIQAPSQTSQTEAPSQTSQEQKDEDEEEATPEKKLEIEGSYDDEPDETLTERIWGLTEMFPESVRNATSFACAGTQAGIKNLYCFSRSALWVVFSTSIILFAPVIFEVERAQMEEMQRSQQKQMLLGPNTAVSSGSMPPLMPPMQR